MAENVASAFSDLMRIVEVYVLLLILLKLRVFALATLKDDGGLGL